MNKSIKEIALTYKTKYDLNLLPVRNKVARNWKEFQEKETTGSIIDSWNWERQNGVAAICGFRDLRCLDFDRVSDFAIVAETLKQLGLPQHYEWVVRSGSGKGYHIWFFADPGETFFSLLGGRKAFYTLNPAREGECDHAEYRHSNCYTLLPFSLHPSGGIYEFMNIREGEFPLSPPAEVREGRLIELIKNLFSGQAAPPPPEEPIVPSKGSIKKMKGRVLSAMDEAFLYEIKLFLKGKINNYADYMRLGFALASLGEKGKNIFVEICRDNPRYPKDTEAKITRDFYSFLKNRNGSISTGTLFFIAHKFGWDAKKHKINFNYVALAADYLNTFYQFEKDMLSERIYFTRKDEPAKLELTDAEHDKILFKLKGDEGMKIANGDLKVIINSVAVQRDPLLEYFTTLPEWDGTDYLSQLAASVKVEKGREELWNSYLKIWLLGVVSCALNPSSVNHAVLVLQGDQGIGKTTWINNLIPEKLREYYYSGDLDPESKDSRLITYRNFVINLDEMMAYRGKKLFSLKSLITEPYTKIRAPYAHIETTYLKRCSFIGSLNHQEFLDDTTGTRRFLVIHVEATDFRHGIDMDKLFAQLFHLYQNGERCYFNYEESLKITENNTLFESTTAEEEKLIKLFRPAEPNDMLAKFLTATEISEKLFDDNPSHAVKTLTISAIGRALSKHRFVKENRRINGVPRKVWRVAENTPGESYVI